MVVTVIFNRRKVSNTWRVLKIRRICAELNFPTGHVYTSARVALNIRLEWKFQEIYYLIVLKSFERIARYYKR